MQTEKKTVEQNVKEKYPIFSIGAERFLSVVKENLQGETLTSQDLERIRIPTGGNLQWSLPCLDGEVNTKEFEGIILHHQIYRVYWKSGIENGQTPPNCHSVDGKTGQGDPGGICEECKLSQFGSSKKKSSRPACRQAKHIYLLRPDAYLPIIMVLPPSSLKPFKQFLLRLSDYNIPSSQIIVSFTLEKATNRSKIAYSIAKFKAKSILETEQSDIIKEYTELLNRERVFEDTGFIVKDCNVM